MTSKRVLFISHSGAMAGSERCLLDLVSRFDPSLVKPIVLAPRDGPLVAELAVQGVPTLVVPFDRWLARRNGWCFLAARAIRTMAFLPALAIAVRRASPDVIYTNSAVVPIGALLARLFGIPHVWHVRELVAEDPGLNTPLGRRRTIRIIGTGSDAIIAVSESVRAQFPGSVQSRIEVIGDGVDVGALSRTVPAIGAFRPGAWPKLLAVGALLYQKGIADLLAVAEELSSRWPNIELVILGDGPDRAAFERLSSAKGLNQVVAFRGFVSDAPAVMRAATLTLSASHVESFGRAVLESVAVGTPVVATKTGAAQAILGKGAGVVVSTHSPSQMATAISRILDVEKCLDTMRLATAAAALSFDVQPVITQVENVIGRVRVLR